MDEILTPEPKTPKPASKDNKALPKPKDKEPLPEAKDKEPLPKPTNQGALKMEPSAETLVPAKAEGPSPAPSLTPTEPESPLSVSGCRSKEGAKPVAENDSMSPPPSRSLSFDSLGSSRSPKSSGSTPKPKSHKFDKYYYQSPGRT